MTSLRVLAVASEIYPIIKTGGLADVAGALPIALRAYGIETRTLVPGYPDVIKAVPAAEVLLDWPNFYGGPIRLLGGSHQNLDLLVLDAPHLFARPGNPYVTPDGKDWPDNGVRFAALSRMAAEIGQGQISDLERDSFSGHMRSSGVNGGVLRVLGAWRLEPGHRARAQGWARGSGAGLRVAAGAGGKAGTRADTIDRTGRRPLRAPWMGRS